MKKIRELTQKIQYAECQRCDKKIKLKKIPTMFCSECVDELIELNKEDTAKELKKEFCYCDVKNKKCEDCKIIEKVMGKC